MFTAVISTGPSSEIRLTEELYKGRRALDVRKWYTTRNEPGVWKPTKKGITLFTDLVQVVQAANYLRAALEAPFEHGREFTILFGQIRETADPEVIRVKHVDFRGWQGYSIDKVFPNGFSKGIWLQESQARHVLNHLGTFIELD
jgi:hypothetical protein